MAEPYCRLYIDTDADRDAVQRAMDAELPRAFPELLTFAAVSKNTGFEAAARARNRYDPIECSPLTIEVDAEDDPSNDVEAFQAGLVRLVRGLRALGWVVTASCDFEDRVARDTGWNWSTATTEPPGR